MSPPLFSIIHPSARPDQWRTVYDAWMGACIDPSRFEYILVADERWGFNRNASKWMSDLWGDARFNPVWNDTPYKHSGYVSSVNLGGAKASGQILIVVADDQFPCEKWDKALIHALTKPVNLPDYPANRDWVLEVSTETHPTHSDHDRGIMPMPILSRARYERLGYVFWPEYESMFADNDFCEHARQDGVVIEARHLVFPHKHWINGKREGDAADKAQNAAGAYTLGAEVFALRRARKFAPVIPEAGKESADHTPVAEQSGADNDARPPVFDMVTTTDGNQLPAIRPPVLAICTPGESFSWEFVANLRRIDYYLQGEFVLQPIMGCVTEPWRARQDMLDACLTISPRPDYVLWIDDDNLPTVEQIKTLYQELTSRNLDMLAGCCWIQFEGETGADFRLSFGYFNEDKTASRMALYPALTGEIVDADWTGFPVVLMRREVLERAGKWAFRPISDDRCETGMMGEDISFCRNASERGGVKIHVHTGVRVPHLKMRAIEPEFVVTQKAKELGTVASQATPGNATPVPVRPNTAPIRTGDAQTSAYPKIVGAMRVKNEGRWIRRCIESLFPLCSAVYVMDDGSTDKTHDEAGWAGSEQEDRQMVQVFYSPFINLPLDEARDKNYLLERIISEQSPDYILWIDGDEELEPKGGEKILKALAERPEVDSWHLRFYYLWNDEKNYRFDGCYAHARRPSLFRARKGLNFASYYQGRGVNESFHVSNAPIQYASTTETLDAFLIHWGYIFREDRIAKYEWYNQRDPHNKIEDEYRHMVIGDVFPPNSVFAHAGPLALMPLPFEIEPLDIERPQEQHVVSISVINLNLGCSDRHDPDFVNVDICEPADKIADLRQRWPWADSVVDSIRAWDIIEHLPDRIHTMNEAFRVLKPGGLFDIIVPTTDGRGAWQDPTHVSFWNRNTFFYFEKGNPHLERFKKAYGTKCAFEIVSAKEERLPDGVTKLRILLQAVKPANVTRQDPDDFSQSAREFIGVGM